MVHVGGFFMGLKKSHRIGNFLLHQIAYFLRAVHKEKTAEITVFQRFS